MSALSEMVRTRFKAGDDIRDAGLTSPEDVTRYDDIVYGEDPKWQIMDLYRPKDKEGETLPVIVSVHGGGWVYGDKERYQYYCMSLAQRGFAVLNFTYRLAPEFKFPAPLEDANTVFQWIFDNAEEYGLDTENIFAVGDSAGAHQLALYAAICTNKEYAKKFPFTVPTGFVPKGIALNCGAYFINVDGSEMDKGLMAEYLPNKGTPEEIETISVVNFMNKDYPPTFLMSAKGDFLLTQVPAMEAKLTELDIPFEYHYYSSTEEKLGHVFHCNMKLKEAARCNDEECNFFKAQMK